MKVAYRATIVAPVFVLLTGCNIITDGAPIWDMTWNVPSKSTSISVNTLLPNGVAVSAGGTTFQANVTTPSPVVRTLGADCSACAASNGQSVPKPAFTTSASASAALPSTVASATLVTDTIVVAITNGFNFDPIRAGAGNVGTITLTATSGTTQLGTTTLSGSTFAIPAGQTTTIKLPISGTVGSSGISVSSSIVSPVGDPVTIDASRQITVTPTVKGATTNTALISSATVNLSNQSVTSSPTNMDLTSIDESVRKRVTGGSMFLTVTNPFNVTGNLTVTITGGRAPVTKTVALAAGTSTPRIDFTGAELQNLLGYNVNLTFGGTVGGSTTVTPGQTVAVATRLQLTLCTDSGANACQ